MRTEITIRVYGLLIDRNRLLVTDEVIRGQRITKFPGGGLEYGEGPLDCLIREIREELEMEILTPRHYYTTEFFQRSTFHTGPMQVLSIYYTFQVPDVDAIHVIDTPFAGIAHDGGKELFRWLDLNTCGESDVDLPIDRVVLGKLIAERTQ